MVVGSRAEERDQIGANIFVAEGKFAEFGQPSISVRPAPAAPGSNGAAQEQALKKTRTDAEEQVNAVILDVRTCIVSLERARRDITLTAACRGPGR